MALESGGGDNDFQVPRGKKKKKKRDKTKHAWETSPYIVGKICWSPG